ncbi:hypothetical protein F4810DRAFT_682104 [Camillea tinctor]|nr:hypothetical protein F4810DRAFT_682104 [Camillea tinctor]
MLFESMDYVIPDHLISVASEALTRSNNLTRCPDTGLRPASSKDRGTLPAGFHMHVNASGVTVGLYLQSPALWFVPRLDDALLTPTRSNAPQQIMC